jgi:hypothetical protein
VAEVSKISFNCQYEVISEWSFDTITLFGTNKQPLATTIADVNSIGAEQRRTLVQCPQQDHKQYDNVIQPFATDAIYT